MTNKEMPRTARSRPSIRLITSFSIRTGLRSRCLEFTTLLLSGPVTQFWFVTVIRQKRSRICSGSFHPSCNDLRMMNPILAIDFGRARIGTAISDGLQLLAHPLETIAANERSIPRITEIVRERKVDHVVVGMPRQLSGKIGTAASQTLDFVEKLRAILPCPVVTWDERLTT